MWWRFWRRKPEPPVWFTTVSGDLRYTDVRFSVLNEFVLRLSYELQNARLSTFETANIGRIISTTWEGIVNDVDLAERRRNGEAL